ncbi:maleylpyruvate isomerase family mycothiol-dependent enzyme [Allonocardiopsis opalescens]|uniref:Uncharacterized protein (TIGR03083 family) n=1 Tax=Allonocardiopsis opalescens TaxID=1144618 RepID=A0A2T0PUK6_9ACTN|nr:maleylpyruvate isomerase family mycothiol-dependent enzyme [Allonocardiopsis opalescens]PRX92488.1 uncharacterized protein (TIGR03083 family) [Allonocardiopsis opalescens]
MDHPTTADRLGPPIDARPLFAVAHAALMDLLRELPEPDWRRPTACPGWSVRDLAAHVLGDHLNRLSRGRDGHTGVLAPRPGETLPAFLDRINDDWVRTARAFSTRVLLDLLDLAGAQIAAYWSGMDDAEMAALGEPVTWAGDAPAPVWLDAARDHTEYWTHEQQIREAVGRPGRFAPEVFGPVLDTFMRALPHTLSGAGGTCGSEVTVTVTGPAGGRWTCRHDGAAWTLRRDGAEHPDAAVEFDPDTAWRLCTRGITPELAAERARTTGDPALTGAVLRMVSIIY